MRSKLPTYAVVIAVLALASACVSHPQATEPPQTSLWIKQLGDSDPQVEADAASKIREAIAKNPEIKIGNDHGEEYWKSMVVSKVKDGMELAAVDKILLDAKAACAEFSKQPTSPSDPKQYSSDAPLDDCWHISFSIVKSKDSPNKYVLSGTPELIPELQCSYPPSPPKNYTGERTDYYFNGQKAMVWEYKDGHRVKGTYFYETGKIRRSICFDESGNVWCQNWNPDGRKSSEGRHPATHKDVEKCSENIKNGTWITWDEAGRKTTTINGVEIKD